MFEAYHKEMAQEKNFP